MRGKSRILQILETAEEVLLSFDNYFSRHHWVIENSGLSPIRGKKNTWYLVNQGVLNKDLSFSKKPTSVLRLIRKPWDQKWRLVAFDIPEKEKVTRNSIRNSLFDLGFRQFQRSVWVSPLAVDSFLVKLLGEIDEQRNFSIFSGNFLNGNSRELVRELWQIEDWASQAEQLIRKFSSKNKKRILVKELRPGFWDLILDHPKVPLDLLPPNWPLKKLVKTFSRINRPT
ncbi:MAG: hypothetical protein ABH867_01820 [Patescibacteria group bacterium]|nr:hypothetical protein [Patescibacteria group bacterium]